MLLCPLYYNPKLKSKFFINIASFTIRKLISR